MECSGYIERLKEIKKKVMEESELNKESNNECAYETFCINLPKGTFKVVLIMN